jgi:hypothetical protein
MQNELIEKAKFILANTDDQPDVDVTPADARALAEAMLAHFAPAKPRLGRVGIEIAYTVDLDDERQVERAKEAAYEDLQNYIKHDEVATAEVFSTEPLSAESIPEFILRETTWLDAAKAHLLELWRGGLDFEDEDGMQETITNVKEKHGLEDDDELWRYLDELIAKHEEDKRAE